MNTNSSSISYLSTQKCKRQDTIVSSRADITKLSPSPITGFGSSRSKMKFPRRNSLTFPLTRSSLAVRNHQPGPVCADDEPFDPLTDLVRKRSVENPAFPLINDIDKALTILNDDYISTKSTKSTSTSTTSYSTVSNDELGVTNHSMDIIGSIEDEVLRMNNHVAKGGARPISTPMPARKKVLQIPAAKRKEMISFSGVKESSHASVGDGLKLTSSNCKQKSKAKKSIIKKSISSLRENTPSRDPSGKSSLRNTSKNSRKQKNKIHFKQTCTMRRTLSRKDMTPKEIRKTWLSAEEYNKMQVRDESLADRINTGQPKKGTCTRGLESKIEILASKKIKLRISGIEEVLVEQERQWDKAGDAVHFDYDFSSFAYVYAPVSEEALATAQAVAKKDRLEADKIRTSSSFFKAKGAAGLLKRSRFTRRRSWA